MLHTAMNDVHVFDWPNRFQGMSDTFKTLQAQKLHTDVVLYADEQPFALHKLVLMSSSDYFEKIFCTNPAALSAVILKDMSGSILKLLIEFMYTGTVRVKAKEREEFISNAISLKLKGIEKILEMNQTKSSPPPHDLSVFNRLHALNTITTNPTLPSGLQIPPTTTLGSYSIPETGVSYFNRLAALGQLQAAVQETRSQSTLRSCANTESDINGISKKRKIDQVFMRSSSSNNDYRISSSPEDVLSKLQFRTHMTTPETQSEPHDMSLSCRSGNTSSPTVSIERVPSSPRSDVPVTNGQEAGHQDDIKPIPSVVAGSFDGSQRRDRSPTSSRRKSSPPIKMMQSSAADADKEAYILSGKNSETSNSPDSKLLIDNGTPVKRSDSPDKREDSSSGENRYSEEEHSDQNDHSTESQTENLAGPSTSRLCAQVQDGILGWPLRNGSANNGDMYSLQEHADKIKLLAQMSLGGSPAFEQLFPNMPFSSFLQQPHNPVYGMSTDESESRSRGSSRKKPTSKPFTCDKCSRSYASAGNLTRHKSYECGVLPKFGCSVCSRTFQHNHSAKLHISTNHPNELRELLLKKHAPTEKIMGISQDKSGDPTTIEKVLAIADRTKNNEKKRNRQTSELDQ